MSSLLQFGDRLMIRWINRLIFLHLVTCVAAIGLAVMLPISIWNFARTLRLPSTLMSEGRIVNIPLVNRGAERWHAPSSAYLCYVQEGLIAEPYLRRENPASRDSLEIYLHPDLGRKPDRTRQVVEVPDNPTWTSVYKSAQGRSIYAASARHLGQLLLTLLVIYIAVRGYWLIKYGPRRQHPGYRR